MHTKLVSQKKGKKLSPSFFLVHAQADIQYYVNIYTFLGFHPILWVKGCEIELQSILCIFVVVFPEVGVKVKKNGCYQVICIAGCYDT